jgi:hypothetical protein
MRTTLLQIRDERFLSRRCFVPALVRTLPWSLAIILLAATSAACGWHGQSPVPAPPPPAAPEPKEKAWPPETRSAPLPRGKKLVLKDGTFQIVRSFERKGDRVRYYSIERSAWEEVPAEMIDWDATQKAEADTAKRQEALLEKVRSREAIEKYQPLDIDASLPIAPGVFLPPGEGLFALEGTMVTPLEQVSAETKLDKKRQIEKIFVPIPIVPTRHRVQIRGPRATLRLTTALPEFYLREAPPDPDRPSSIQKSSRPGESGPEVELIRATLRNGTRLIEVLDTNIVGQQAAQRNTISLQRWEVAKGVYRFTLSEPLTPGEYAIAQMLPEGMNLYVWDFGVDLGPGSDRKSKPVLAKKPPQPANFKP